MPSGVADTQGRTMLLINALGRTTGRKLLTSAIAIGVAGSIAGLGSWAAFTSSTSASHQASTGTVTAAIGAAGGVDNRLTVAASNIAAGDTIERAVKFSNTGSLDWSTATLTTTASVSSLLDTDATHGLQMEIDECSVAWTESASAPYTYTCSGDTTSVIASRAVIGSSLSLGSLSALTAGGSDFLRVKLTLPSTAGNTFQGISSTIGFAFNATQRTATAA